MLSPEHFCPISTCRIIETWWLKTEINEAANVVGNKVAKLDNTFNANWTPQATLTEFGTGLRLSRQVNMGFTVHRCTIVSRKTNHTRKNRKCKSQKSLHKCWSTQLPAKHLVHLYGKKFPAAWICSKFRDAIFPHLRTVDSPSSGSHAESLAT